MILTRIIRNVPSERDSVRYTAYVNASMITVPIHSQYYEASEMI